jgi:hypothetical protein
MAVNKPVGDNARKGAVNKRTQRKSKVMGKPAWTTRQEIRRVHGGEEEREKIQGRPARKRFMKSDGPGVWPGPPLDATGRGGESDRKQRFNSVGDRSFRLLNSIHRAAAEQITFVFSS